MRGPSSRGGDTAHWPWSAWRFPVAPSGQSSMSTDSSQGLKELVRNTGELEDKGGILVPSKILLTETRQGPPLGALVVTVTALQALTAPHPRPAPTPHRKEAVDTESWQVTLCGCRQGVRLGLCRVYGGARPRGCDRKSPFNTHLLTWMGEQTQEQPGQRVPVAPCGAGSDLPCPPRPPGQGLGGAWATRHGDSWE